MRILGIDYGSKRVGLSMSDPSGTVATPLGVRHRISAGQDAEFFRELVRSHQLARIVVGLPRRTDGAEADKAQEARRYGAWLAAELGLPVDYWDERFSTVQAEKQLRRAGVRPRGRKRRRDMLAAQIMLQAYLDANNRKEQAVAVSEEVD